MSIAWDANRHPAATLLDAIGRTPLVGLRRIGPDGLELLAKVEWYGPTGSVKDRIYAHMLAKAEERGDLRPGMTIVECTTGNAGIACAAVAAIKGYACVIVMPEGMSEERKTMIRGYGAELVLTPGAGTDIDLAMETMRKMVEAEPDRYFVPAEFENADNPQAQMASGEEIWEQTGGRAGRRRCGARNRWMDQRRRAGIEGSRPRGPRLRRRAGRVPPDLRATVGNARRPRHRRRDHPAQPRSRDHGRHRDGVDRRSARHGGAARPRRRAALRTVVGHQRRRGVEGGRLASGVPPDRDRDRRHGSAVPVR